MNKSKCKNFLETFSLCLVITYYKHSSSSSEALCRSSNNDVFDSFPTLKFINQLKFKLLSLPMTFLSMQVAELHLGCDGS